MGSMSGFGPHAWRVAKWTIRGLLGIIALAAIVWSAALFVGSMRLSEALDQAKSDPRFANPAPDPWDAGAPDDNGAPYFAAAFALHRHFDAEIGPSIQAAIAGNWGTLPGDKQVAVRAWLESKKPAFDLAAEGARRPRCRFVRSWTSNPWETYAPEVGGVAYLGRSCIARAAIQVSDGDSTGARESIRLAFAVADSLRDEPPRESMTFRIGLHESIMKALLHIIPRELTLQECDEWRRIIPLPESYDGVLERTHQWDAHVVVNVLSGSMDRFWHAWREAKRGRWEGGFQRRLADPLVKLDGVLALEELRRIRDIVGKPYPVARGELQSMWREWHARSRGWNPVRAVFVIPHSFYLDRVQISRAASTLIRTGLDWEKARIDTGKYPERCDVIDPLTGEPLVHDAKLGRLTIKGVEGFGSIQPFHWSFRK